MHSWLDSLKKIFPKPVPVRLPEGFAALLAQKKAAVLRLPLKEIMTGKGDFVFDQLMEEARQAGWGEIELNKLVAYGEFFSGLNAAAYQRVIAGHLAETDFDLFMTTCVHCYLADRFEEGYALLQQFKPEQGEGVDWAEFFAFAGYMTLAAGADIDEAVAYFDQALDQGLDIPLLAVNAYPIYFEAGRHERVDQLRRLIHEKYAQDPEAVYAMACVELARDYYPEGFRLAEFRYTMPEVARSINPTLLDKPRWGGESLQDRRLLVHGEQGYGDIIMIARYLPMVRALGGHVIVDCREAAIPLLAHNFPDCEIIAGDLKQPIATPFDVWAGAMSLPLYFNTTADSVPATEGYLTVPPEQAAYWHDRVAGLASGRTPRIGLAWSGNPSHRADKRRSIAFERMARHLQENQQIRFFSLQISVPADCPDNLINTSEEMVTLADTAALIAEMDLVITVDTSIVHIAGALGKPTWLLLPRRYEWRWSLEGEKNNWYDSVRVLRQKTHGDWDGLLAEVFGHQLGGFFEGLSMKQAEVM